MIHHLHNEKIKAETFVWSKIKLCLEIFLFAFLSCKRTSSCKQVLTKNVHSSSRNANTNRNRWCDVTNFTVMAAPINAGNLKRINNKSNFISCTGVFSVKKIIYNLKRCYFTNWGYLMHIVSFPFKFERWISLLSFKIKPNMKLRSGQP